MSNPLASGQLKKRKTADPGHAPVLVASSALARVQQAQPVEDSEVKEQEARPTKKRKQTAQSSQAQRKQTAAVTEAQPVSGPSQLPRKAAEEFPWYPERAVEVDEPEEGRCYLGVLLENDSERQQFWPYLKPFAIEEDERLVWLAASDDLVVTHCDLVTTVSDQRVAHLVRQLWLTVKSRLKAPPLVLARPVRIAPPLLDLVGLRLA